MRLLSIKKEQGHMRETVRGKEPVSALAARLEGGMVKNEVSDTETKSRTGNLAGLDC
jgi:hypothetical protein